MTTLNRFATIRAFRRTLSFGLLWMMLLQAGPALADGVALRDRVPTLTVTGQAKLEKPADQLRMSIGVVTQDEQAAEAVRRNARQMRRIIEALEDAGLTDEEYSTGQYQLTPVYTQRPRDPAPDWAPRIQSYRVVNMLLIRTEKLDEAGKLIDVANEAGANRIENIQFGLADARRHRTEAITQATQNAMDDARVLARASERTLRRIITIELDAESDHTPPRPFEMGRVAMMEAEPTSLVAGDVTIRATVRIVYEVGGR